MALHDIRYRHWTGEHEGIWRRRRVIAESGLRACLQGRWSRYLVAVAWLTAMVYVAVLFCVGQLLVADSIIVKWAAHLAPQLQRFASGLTTWLELHPALSVNVAQNFLFYWFALILLPGSLVAVALTIPQLITRDLASNAIIIYASKAVNWFDYLLGKAGIVLGMLTLTWLGPLLAAWLAGNLLAPNWSFFWHARWALGHTLGYVLLAMVFLTLLGLGISTLARSEKATVGLYVALWLIGWALEPLGDLGQPWLKQFSFHYNLQQAGQAVFSPQRDLETARQNVPVPAFMMRGMERQRGRDQEPQPDPAPPWLALGVFAAASLSVVLIRTKPQ